MNTLDKDISIRNYRHPDDYPAVFQVWEKAGKGIHITLSDSIDEIEKFTKKSPGLFFVACAQNTIVGTVMAGFDGRRAIIYHLAVLPEYQGRKIGTNLLIHVENQLKLSGCGKLYLLIMPGNPDLEEYYRNRGYEKMEVSIFTKIL